MSGNLYLKPAWWYYPSCWFHENSYDRIVWVPVCQMEWPNELCSLTSQQILCEIIFYLMFATYTLATYGGQVLIWYLPTSCDVHANVLYFDNTSIKQINMVCSFEQPIVCGPDPLPANKCKKYYKNGMLIFYKILTQWQVGPWIYLVNWGSVRFTRQIINNMFMVSTLFPIC